MVNALAGLCGQGSGGQGSDGTNMSVLEQFAHVLMGNIPGAWRSRISGGVTWPGEASSWTKFCQAIQ